MKFELQQNRKLYEKKKFHQARTEKKNTAKIIEGNLLKMVSWEMSMGKRGAGMHSGAQHQLNLPIVASLLFAFCACRIH